MCKYFLSAVFILCWTINTSFALPVKQKETIEILIVEGSFEKALAAIENLRDSVPDDSDLLLLKGICYYNLETHKTQAPPILLNALALSKTRHADIDITYHLAQAYLACSDYENACKNYERLQKIVPPKFTNLHKKIESQITFCRSRLSASHTGPHIAEKNRYTVPSCRFRSNTLRRDGNRHLTQTIHHTNLLHELSPFGFLLQRTIRHKAR